ncbi:hypothetical protein [Mucilaginibacter myungsuensis]|uniref:Uncharacterized protein n=1 Tax=Mucilaginibacter myungsuensis TaxID=649104 RepID=A0A929PZ06_9SPHI|nr:hypothetical protein [Mucilaginibacter myungsuensis]MBE9663892.1 hypothetical protein [Mucilaginibacter myungsuensis]MDN3598392.1 hypothetical protein [Mucilaginibacter myungsuensis]
MKTERTIMMTGKEYQHIKEQLETNAEYEYHTGTEFEPETLTLTDIYLDTDPDFTRNPEQFARIDGDLSVQVKVVYEE